MSVLDDLEEMLGGLGGAGGALDGLTEAMGRLNNNALQTQAALARSGQAASDAQGRFVATGAGANSAAGALDALKGKASSLLDSLVPTTGALGAVADGLKSLGPEGEAAAVVLGVVVTVVTGLAQTLWDWAAAAVAAAQKRDALRDAFDALGGGAGAGERVLAQTTALAAQLPFVTSQVNSWAKAMAMVGKEGGALDQSVKAIAASAAITRTAGDAAQSLIKRWALMGETGQKVKLDRRQLSALAESGADLNELARILGVTKDKLGGMSLDAKKLGDAFEQALINKGGPALEDLGLTWDSIKAKFNEGLGSIFSGMSDAVKPLMIEIKSLFGEFNKGSTTIGAAKSVMTSFLTTVFGWATRAMHAIHVGFLTVQIGALQLYIALGFIVKSLRAVFSNAQVIMGLKAGLMLLAVPFILIGAVIAGVIIVVGAVGVAIAYTASLIVGAVAWIAGAVATAFNAVIAWFVRLKTSGVDAGGNFIRGLVGGIVSGVGAVVDAVKGLASKVVSSFTDALGIKSPSRVMRAHGKQLPAGAAEGIDEGADDAQRSMENMLEPPKAKPRARSTAAQTARGNITVNFYGSAKDFPSFREQAMKFFQEELGAGPEPA